MEKTLYIHIGAHKTGTSAIQSFLSENREKLKEKGVLYPGFRTEHHEMSHEYLNNTLDQIKAGNNSPTKKILSEIALSSCNTVIISSEGFSRLWDNIAKLKIMIPDEYCVKIIYYVRRQDEQVEAIYNQVVKDIKGREILKFKEYIRDGYLLMMDYEKVLDQWGETFGHENIIVRCYEKSQFSAGNIFSDFLGAVGLNMEPEYIIPEKVINQSLDWNAIEFIRLCNIQFRDDRKFQKFLMSFFENNNIYIGKKTHLLSSDERINILGFYEKSNNSVAKRYLGRSDGILFYDPLPDGSEPFKPPEELTVEKIVPVFTQILYNIDLKNQREIRKIQNMQKSQNNTFFGKCRNHAVMLKRKLQRKKP